MHEIPKGLVPAGPDQKNKQSSIFEKPLLNNGTREFPLSQEGRLISRALHRFVNLASSTGLLVISISSPVDLPFKPGTESQVVPSIATLMHGDKDTAHFRQNVLLVADEGTSSAMIQRATAAYYTTPPLNELKKDINIFAVRTSEVLNCNQQGKCNGGAVRSVIDKNIANTGIIFHETMVIVNRKYPFGSTGVAFLESKQGPTSIYTYAAAVIPEITEVNRDFQEMIDKGIASTEDHESAHSVFGFDHEGSDMMEGQDKCNPSGAGDGGMCHSFNEDHKERIRERAKAFPGTYHTPVLLEPAPSVTTGGLGTTLKFEPYGGFKQFQVQVIPYNNDGPGINLIIGDPKTVQTGTFNILPPQLGEGNYTMLPGMSYTWRVRGTSIIGPVGENDPVWGHWSKERKFRTPATSSATLRLPTGSSLASLSETPFVWTDTNKSNFYYEIQASGDSRFDTDPSTATSFVWWNLIHGGMTNPLNSWRAPSLTPETTYFWRVRPRVQGDGIPVEWGPTWAVRTGADNRSYTISQVEKDENGNLKFTTIYEYKAPSISQAKRETQADGQKNIKFDENDCIRDFIGSPIRSINDILDPACYRLMDLPTVTLKEGDVRVRFNSQEGVLLNREQRRKAVRLAQKSA